MFDSRNDKWGGCHAILVHLPEVTYRQYIIKGSNEEYFEPHYFCYPFCPFGARQDGLVWHAPAFGVCLDCNHKQQESLIAPSECRYRLCAVPNPIIYPANLGSRALVVEAWQIVLHTALSARMWCISVPCANHPSVRRPTTEGLIYEHLCCRRKHSNVVWTQVSHLLKSLDCVLMPEGSDAGRLP